MPELPEVETVKNGIAQFAGKAEIVDVTVRNRRLRSVVPDGFETAVRGAKIKEPLLPKLRQSLHPWYLQ